MSSDPLKKKISSLIIEDRETDVVCASFDDRNLVVVTQYKKLGTILSVTTQSLVDFTKGSVTFDVKMLMGKDDPILHAYAKAIGTVVHDLMKENKNSISSGKPLLCTLAISNPTPTNLAEICNVIKQCNVF
uniref:proteasome assembly chaperone 3-like n=1 Tax=Ciona intestinalis TaxID=7719 RepID=UPI0002B8DD25|nr:proteasome assembly chaperone 3-like [Ciona intestinalis]|eukprot:XP_004225910.1 proteasome assembly chaperone 3-like [Ciona intestinalis]